MHFQQARVMSNSVIGRIFRAADLGNGQEIEGEKQICTLLALSLARSRDQLHEKFGHDRITHNTSLRFVLYIYWPVGGSRSC